MTATMNGDESARHGPPSLELSPEQMRAMSMSLLERLIHHVETLEEQPPGGQRHDLERRRRALREPAPEQGADFESLIAPLFDDWIHASYNSASPGYLSFVPGGGIFPAALADFASNVINPFTGLWTAAPLLVELEKNVLDWLRDFMGFPGTTAGLLTTGGSMATFSALVSAREERLGHALREGVMYLSSEAHRCIPKAARLAGILSDRIREVPVDERLRMRVDALAELVTADRRRGLKPFLVTSSAGTVNSGAVDPLAEIAALCRREGLWHHCDAAYGGFFRLCPELRPLLSGIEQADSLTLDPHKGLFLPYGTGALLVRDGAALRRAHDEHASYLPETPEGDFYHPSQHGPELSRDFRGLRLWLPLKLFGVGRFRRMLLEKHRIAVATAEEMQRIEGIELLEHPTLSLFAFRLGWPGATERERSEATRSLLEGVAGRGRAFLSGTILHGSFYARLCVLSFRTQQAHTERCLADVAEVARGILAER